MGKAEGEKAMGHLSWRLCTAACRGALPPHQALGRSPEAPEPPEPLQVPSLWEGPAYLESLVDVSVVVHHLSLPRFALGALRDK